MGSPPRRPETEARIRGQHTEGYFNGTFELPAEAEVLASFFSLMILDAITVSEL
jgi:hypothetical protein